MFSLCDADMIYFRGKKDSIVEGQYHLLTKTRIMKDCSRSEEMLLFETNRHL